MNSKQQTAQIESLIDRLTSEMVFNMNLGNHEMAYKLHIEIKNLGNIL